MRAALARGDLLSAYDEVARRGDTSVPELNYLEVLTLARLGDTERGLKLYDDYRLEEIGGVDPLSLKARLLKDQAFDAPTPDPERLMDAARLYLAVYEQTKSSYPAINAATLAKIAGQRELASSLAHGVAEDMIASGRSDYFSLATLAEALAVTGDVAGARGALERAMQAPDADVGARSTTVLQLRRLIAAEGEGHGLESLLELIQPPKVAMFCGNIFISDPELDADLSARMREVIARENVGFGYGALAAGSDILIAELLLERGAEIHVVLPFAEADFIEQSVAPAGEEWVARYRAILDRSASVTYASNMSYMGEMSQFAYGSKVSMGMARLRARQLHAEAIQLVIVEERGDRTLSGSDVTSWRDTGRRSEVVVASKLIRPTFPPPPPALDVERGTYGLMFTDYPGFSKLEERVLPLFWEDVMVRAARSLERHGEVIRSGNTWGDAIFAVFQDAPTAALAALDLCEELKKVDCKTLGVREGTAMRIALHYGPTYSGYDPVTRRTTYYGNEVSRAARIEPITPSGAVYVTEPFAAVLEMEKDHRFDCDYVGKIALPKGYGVYPIYRLSRSPTGR
ncbi:tetratricopeptide repeat-containing protein [Phenylobacterium sp.]|uniref:tetratricopeptide repeat-containing protein n=1 Tax=Phenylobacterium sp. TaxID=1871053 RepID=UPI002E362EAB|nr:adenylate/guanylate cyclase domain-containing protein [Phenylobacterium sp.]HEX3366428.1 adenylate/guanylate cyclase domain-containing protein [Phenylobacterium sp.]